MNTSANKFDSLDSLIFEQGLRISNIEIHKEVDALLIFLNTQHIISLSLSAYPFLKKAKKADLKSFRLIADGTGIHWPALDQDFSLKGFLKSMLVNQLILNDNRQSVIA